MSKKLIVQTVAFGQGRPSLTDATAARFNTPTASPPTPTHRAAEARIKNEREQQKNSQGPVPKKEAPGAAGRVRRPEGRLLHRR